jgi:hypothetical protein
MIRRPLRVGGGFYDGRVSSKLPLEPDAERSRVREQGERSSLVKGGIRESG